MMMAIERWLAQPTRENLEVVRSALDFTRELHAWQTDEDELGFTYADADRVLVAVYDLGMSPAQAAKRTGVDRDVADRVLARAAGVAWKHAVPHTL